MNTGLTTARSLLFVPGNRPERFVKAVSSGADLVVCDLEDAVTDGDKASARASVADWLASGAQAAVRINAVGTPEHADDLAALAGIVGLAGVIVPMAEHADALAIVIQALPGVPVLALIETARGLRAAQELASVPGVVRLGIGHLDLAFDLGADPDDPLLTHARVELVISARAAGSAAPVDGVTTDVKQIELVRADSLRARRSGFGGKLCIHPAQVGEVNTAFAPSVDEIQWATRVLAVSQEGVAVVDGQMVDAPVIARARGIAARSTTEKS